MTSPEEFINSLPPARLGNTEPLAPDPQDQDLVQAALAKAVITDQEAE